MQWHERMTAKMLFIVLALVYLAALPQLLDAQVYQNEVLKSSHTPCQSQYYKWPACADKPTGYECHCGPGYFWNTHMCISTAVNSRLEFPAAPPTVTNGTHTYAYTLLLATQFPSLDAFTVSFWIEVANASHPGVIFSYKYDTMPNVLLMTSGPTVNVFVNGESIDTGYKMAAEKWTYLTFTWSSHGAQWQFYVNGKLWLADRDLGIKGVLPLPAGGDFVLGQVAARGADSGDVHHFSLEQAFVGSLSLFNIWDYAMTEDSVKSAYADCTYTHCGSAVEWISFRSGTRGAARLRWPSGVPGGKNCFTEEQSIYTCEKYCGVVEGVRCKESTHDNILWWRSGVGTTLTLPCPGHQVVEHLPVNHSASSAEDIKQHLTRDDKVPHASRTCQLTADGDADWSAPETSQCLSTFFKLLNEEINAKSNEETDNGEVEMTWLIVLENHTRLEALVNPTDLTTAVAALRRIVDSQWRKLEKQSLFRGAEPQVNTYGSKRKPYDKAFNHTAFADLFLKTVGHLLAEKNGAGWNATIPLALEAARLLRVVDSFGSLLAASFARRHRRGDIALSETRYRGAADDISLEVKVMSSALFKGLTFPDASYERALKQHSPKTASLSVPAGLFDNLGTSVDQLSIVVVRYDKVSLLLPNPETFGTADDNVNSAVMSVSFRDETGLVNVTVPFTIEFSLIENVNVSNAACFSSEVGNSSVDMQWRPVVIAIHNQTHGTIRCKYSGSGIFGVTTDMYDRNWRQPEVVLELFSAPAYIGCSISLLLCMLTLALLVYIRTSTCTSLIHKHLATSVVLGNLTFIIGMGLMHDEVACRTFAISFHYFFLANFTWLMNEGFNLYYVVTYTAHNQANQATSSGVRYYIIGWVLPALIVGIVVGVYYDNYFASDVCWVDWSMIWFFVGPPLAIICVTILVMTFAAKESTEMSYTKNEAANKLTEYHSRAVWTQILLLTMTWAFAMAMLRFRGSVFKWVYMIFACMQGSFFFVFYFLLNEEVRTVIKGKEIRRELGWEVTGVDDSMLFDCNDEAIPLTLKEKKEKAELESGKRPSKRRSARGRQPSVPAAIGAGSVHARLADAEELDDLMVTSI